jgi:hypothetical protein
MSKDMPRRQPLAVINLRVYLELNYVQNHETSIIFGQMIDPRQD